MKTLKKFSVGNVSETLSDSQKKRVVGGYDNGDCGPGLRLYHCYCDNSVSVCAYDSIQAAYIAYTMPFGCKTQPICSIV